MYTCSGGLWLHVGGCGTEGDRTEGRMGSVNEIVIFSVGSRSAVNRPCEENFILAKNLPLDGTKPGSSLLFPEGLLGRSPPGGAFWPSGTAGANPPLGRKSGFGYSGCSQRAGPALQPGAVNTAGVTAPGFARVQTP